MRWGDVAETDWNDWHWQLKNRVSSAEELAQIIQLTPEERAGLNAQDLFRVDITPYFARLIDPVNPNCPIRRQVIPLGRELQSFTGMMADSLAEDEQSPVLGLVHRYPDRVLMLVTTQCASYCRYCTRSRMVGDWNKTPNIADFERQLDYLRRNSCIRDVLISGGDPLTLSDTVIHYLLSQLRSIKHIEIIRIGTRIPIFLPQRITPELCSLLQQFHPLWINIHTNHPQEITTEVSQALERLANAGIPLGNQSVLLAGINDSAEVQRKLVHKLVKNRVRPYYLYQCDLVQGAGHFRTSIDRGLDIMKSLQGYTSGYAVPKYVVDAPGGGGKVVISPQNMLSKEPGNQVFLRTYKGDISMYQEPPDYVAEDFTNLA
ncbi:KamA family radical SAM protein [Nodosilinea sp. E11]|uniref:KamA family radical SAM protein n=1 Tax=Nodosilinea sp. E11 TaxID=3037479 RepID=UPI002934E1AE|nr:KamA family radical SAM protein [Nodosilinea sp. E11]WOD37065.1 KamA family radical SAM protein [Nodosilinea sp. E11]